jgi:hypothetical protein
MDKIATIVLAFCLVLSAGACAAAPAAVTPKPTAEPTWTLRPTATFTPIPPTDTPAPTNTPVPPTDTPIPPTATFTHTAEPTATSTVEMPPCLAGSGTSRQVRLTIINKSGYDVFMNLKNCSEDTFYRIIIPRGTTNEPVTRDFNILGGFYQAMIIQCDGSESGNILPLEGNLRLTFTSCGSEPTATATP